jgi:hypothetical protein
MTRLLPCAAAILCLAFAPAPFLPTKKPPRPPLEGLWEVIAGEAAPKGGKGGFRGRTTFIRIEPGRWTFLNQFPCGGLHKSAEYHLKLTPGALLGIELRRNQGDARAYGKGVLRVDGDEMRLSYGWGETLPQPTSLDPPGNGRINFTLRRIKEPMK